ARAPGGRVRRDAANPRRRALARATAPGRPARRPPTSAAGEGEGHPHALTASIAARRRAPPASRSSPDASVALLIVRLLLERPARRPARPPVLNGPGRRQGGPPSLCPCPCRTPSP